MNQWNGPVNVALVADNLGDPEVVLPPRYCTKIGIRESGGLASTGYRLRAPFKVSPPLTLGAGERYEAKGEFWPTVPAFYVETLAGSVTFTVVFE